MRNNQADLEKNNVKINTHEDFIVKNKDAWEKKPLLRKIYHGFYEVLASQLVEKNGGKVVELGSGFGAIKDIIPQCVTTEVVKNQWVEQAENAYELSFGDEELSNIILFDIFHHLKYPGDALKEMHRVLMPKGRVIIFEPYISLLGIIVYGLLHKERVSLFEDISPYCFGDEELENYYAAQGNATRIFFGRKYSSLLTDWKIISRRRMSCLSYVLSGGYSSPQLYPEAFLELFKKIDVVLDLFPWFFSTRLLVVLEKKPD